MVSSISRPLHHFCLPVGQLVPQAVDVPDGLQDDVQLCHIVFDGHGGYQLLQSEIEQGLNMM